METQGQEAKVLQIPKLGQLEKGIPMPRYTKRTEEGFKIPFKKMEVGDSILIPVSATKENLNRVRTRVYYMKEKAHSRMKLTVNTDPISGTKLRVWRTG